LLTLFQPTLPLVPPDAISLTNNSLVLLIDYILNNVVSTDGDLGIYKMFNNLTDGAGNHSEKL
jgi:hypothetical protein